MEWKAAISGKMLPLSEIRAFYDSLPPLTAEEVEQLEKLELCLGEAANEGHGTTQA